MAEEGRTVRDELDYALVEGVKRIILEKIDDGTLRNYLLEETAKVLQRHLTNWSLTRAIEETVQQKIGERIPEIVDEVLARDEFKNALAESVADAIQKGIERGAHALQQKLAQTIA